ncbi:MAG: phosphoenolpyruvate synthase [Bacteroidales bacterium]|nr:phosphoenolpyruvate synthase [Bacteroidales bacterium]
MINKAQIHIDKTVHKDLMQKRIHKILIICSSYDAFILEEDGRIDEQIFNEYVSLNLRYPPFFVRVPSAKRAYEEISKGDVNLIIAMPSITDSDLFDFSKKIKNEFFWIPFVILTPFSRDISLRLASENLIHIDYIFSWLGNTDIMLAIIKLVEDKLNAEADIEKGVQAILLVEDSIRYYSSFLPTMYRMIFKHHIDMEYETLNEHQKMLRKRGRPKVLLARTYEEAQYLFEKYKSNILGVISDVGYPKDGVRDKHAGLKLTQFIKSHKAHIPIVLQSSEKENRIWADKFEIGFLHKNSPNLLHRLRNFMKNYLAFGDFIFINPTTKTELMRAPDLKTLQHIIYKVPDFSLKYHLSRNHLSRWLKTRALFSLGAYLADFSIDQFENLGEIQEFIASSIKSFRKQESSGVIAKFNCNTYDEYVSFARIGEGMIGGKARGLAFLDLIISKHKILNSFENVKISIPQTVILATSIFDEFMEQNNLFEYAISEHTDKEIVDAFINAQFPAHHKKALISFIKIVNRPIAIRSSSLLEDSHYQPFAGVYSTYMVPCTKNIDETLSLLIKGIKSVYASVYYHGSKTYMQATQNMIDEEKMAIVLQEICGETHNNKFYPIISGVARSVNFYPVASEKTEDGIANIAFGLGKQIVEGEANLRFSPGAPDKTIQLANPQLALKQTQKHFYALDMSKTDFIPSTDDAVTLKRFRIKEAEKDNTLNLIASTYDFNTDSLNDGEHYTGKKVITFNNILKYKKIPLANILQTILKIGQKKMGHAIEIEFALNFDFKKSDQVCFKLLQIRPIVENIESVNIDDEDLKNPNNLIVSNRALGNGKIDDVNDLIYVKPETFDPSNNLKIAEIISKLNDNFVANKSNYILVGPGRWGSSDRWLGIPVKWTQISAARIIIESGLDDYRIEPSQGTHFFQNLTAFRVGYFTINPYIDDGLYDIEFLNNQPAIYEDEFVRHVRFNSPMIVKIDGKKRIGIIEKPNLEN